MSLYAEGLTVLFFLDLAVPFFWAFRMFLTRDMLSPILAIFLSRVGSVALAKPNRSASQTD